MIRMDPRDIIAEINPDAWMPDGFDEALIGIAERFGAGPVPAYDYERCIQILMKQGMSREGAGEFFEFNVLGTCLDGPDRMPVYVTRIGSDGE